MQNMCFLFLVIFLASSQFSQAVDHQCSAPRAPVNGLKMLFDEGRLVRFRCHPGYAMIGKAWALCSSDQWSSITPECFQHKKAVGRLYGEGPKRLPLINGIWPRYANQPLFTSHEIWLSPDETRQVKQELGIAALRAEQENEVKRYRGHPNSVISYIPSKSHTASISSSKHSSGYEQITVVNRTRPETTKQLFPHFSRQQQGKSNSNQQGGRIRNPYRRPNSTSMFEKKPSPISTKSSVHQTKTERIKAIDSVQKKDRIQILEKARQHQLRMKSEREKQDGEKSNSLERKMDVKENEVSREEINEDWLNRLNPELKNKFLDKIVEARNQKKSDKSLEIEDISETKVSKYHNTGKSSEVLRHGKGKFAANYLGRQRHSTNRVKSSSLNANNKVWSQKYLNSRQPNYDTSCVENNSIRRAPYIQNAFVADYNTIQGPRGKHLEAVYRCTGQFELQNPKHDRLFCRSQLWVAVHIPKCVEKDA